MQKLAIFLCLSVVFAIPAIAQKVTVFSVNEQRSTSESSYNNRCEIDLKISGDEVRKSKFVKISSITRVTDDQDLNLINEEDNDFEYEEIEEGAMLKVITKVPSRKAEVIKELSGEVHLYTPTEANGGLMKILDYQAKANKNLVPDAAGVQLIYLTKESMASYSKEQKEKKEADLNKLTGVSKEIAELLIQAVDFFGYAGAENEENQAMFVMGGDEGKLVDMYFEDSSGKKIERNGYSKMNNLATYYYDEQPKANWKLVINIETAGSVKKVPFTLKNIDLP